MGSLGYHNTPAKPAGREGVLPALASGCALAAAGLGCRGAVLANSSLVSKDEEAELAQLQI